MFKFLSNDKNKNVVNSDEYERISKRISELSARQEILDNKIEMLKTDVSNLRGRFNQRLKGFSKEEETQSKDINTGENIYLG